MDNNTQQNMNQNIPVQTPAQQPVSQPPISSTDQASAPQAKKSNNMLMILILIILLIVFGGVAYYYLASKNTTPSNSGYQNKAVPTSAVVLPPLSTPTPQVQGTTDVNVPDVATDVNDLNTDLQGL